MRGLCCGPGGRTYGPGQGGLGGRGAAGFAQHGGDSCRLVGSEVEQPDPLQSLAGRRGGGDDAVGGDLAGDARRPGAEHDRGRAQAAACFQDAAQPLRGAGIAGGDQRGARSRSAGCGGLLVAAVEAARGAGLAQDGGFHLIQRRVQGGGDQDAGDLGRVLAGKQPGGVGCRDDDRRGHPGRGGRGPGQQGGEDRAGGGGRAGTGQAQPAEGGDVEGGLAGPADAERNRAGLGGRHAGARRRGRAGGFRLRERGCWPELIRRAGLARDWCRRRDRGRGR